MRFLRVICFILLYLLSTNSNKLSAQGKLSEQWIPNPSDTTYENIIEHLEVDYQLSFNYSPNILKSDHVFPVRGSSSIKELFDLIFIEQSIDYDILDDTRILLYRRKSNKISISGVIRDFESKESIPAASIFIKETNQFIVATDDGYFYLEANDVDSLSLTFNSISYNETSQVKRKSEDKLVVELKANVNAPIIVITPKIVANDYIKGTPGPGISPLGLDEITEQIKNNPMVQNGNEGQTGFVVKGSTTDQNLILMDGMPVYNASHIGGLSSIFIGSAVKDVKVHTSGISAQYGGKLASVMDIQIKEGNTEEIHGRFTTGLTGAEAHIESPIIKNKTALSLSGRYSWLDLLSDSFFEQYEDSSINYYDVYAKLHHKISATNRLSLSFYKGNDQLYLLSEERLGANLITDSAEHDFNWGNEILSLQWNWLINKAVSVNSKIGYSKYKLRGVGEYFISDIDEQELFTDISASSEIQDLVASTKFDIYNTSIGKVNFGANVILHSFKPELLEIQFVDGVITSENGTLAEESKALEVNGFVENEIEFGDRATFRGGLHISNFSDQDTSFFIIEPRAKMSWKINKQIIDLNLSLNHQYIHLLTNPGTGLPSDLWVPSSKEISPARSQELSLDYRLNFNENWSFQGHAYVKMMTSIKSYKGTSDVIFRLLGENIELGQFVTSEPDWRDRVEEGRGFSTGIGGLIKYESEKWNFFSSYSYNYTSNLFNQQEGFFFARHHRPHDILVQASFMFNENWSACTKFVYGSGIRYTFPAEFIPGPPVEFRPLGRNLETLDAFHHLDVNIKYKKKYSYGTLDVNVGVYNLYNRENIFFTYLKLDNNLAPEEEKIGLLRLLPNASLSFSF